MIKLITQNPYRLLGVYSNSPAKERIANENKMKAFLKVGKAINFPLDLPSFLSPVNRTEETVSVAKASLTLPADQLKHGQFWFMKEGPFDEEAFNHLFAGDLAKAIEIWSKKDSVSSLQNRVICALIKDDYSTACSCAEKLYSRFTDAFVTTVAGDTVKRDNLGFDFLDSLAAEVGANKLLPYIDNKDWLQYLNSAAVAPVIESIQTAIDTAKASRRNGPTARYNAGIKLINDTKSLLTQLNQLMPKSDMRYQMIVDKLANEILQCGIDYYNESEDNDAANKAMKIQKYAQSISTIGSITRDRCDENVRILNEIIEKLPPVEILLEYNSLMELIKDFVDGKKEDKSKSNQGSDGIVSRIFLESRRGSFLERLAGRQLPDATHQIDELLEKARPLVISMKEKVSSQEPHLTEICLILANVILNKSVESLNKAQAILGDMAKKLKASYIGSFEQTSYNSTLSKFLIQLSSCWRILSELELLPLSEDFIENRIEPNKQALVNISRGLPVSFSSVDDTLYYTDDEFYKTCSSYPTYKTYLERYPNGRHIEDARTRMRNIEKRVLELCVSIKDYESFIKKYPKSEFIPEAKKAIEDLEYKSCKTYHEYVHFVKSHANSEHCAEAEIRIKEIETKAYDACHTYNDYVGFVKDYPNSTLVSRAKNKMIEIRREIESKLRSCTTVQDCVILYRQYASDPDQIIDKHAYSLCAGKSDLKQYKGVFSFYRKEAEETISKSNQRIAIAIIAIIVILTIIVIALSKS